MWIKSVSIQAACMTHMGYTTTQYIYSSSGVERIADKMWSVAVFSLSRLASYSQLCVCVDECEQTFLRAERQKASALPFTGTRKNTLWRRCCSTLAPRAQSAAIYRCRYMKWRARSPRCPAEVLFLFYFFYAKLNAISWQCRIRRCRSAECYKSLFSSFIYSSSRKDVLWYLLLKPRKYQ